MNKEIKEDALKTDSKISAMRVAFIRTVNVALWLAILGVAGTIGATFMDKKVDLMAIGAIIGILLTAAFGGKTGQSFAEREPTLPKE
jgi:hypothetical protein